MLTLTAENHFEDWRAKARTLLLAGVSPNEVIWEEPGQNGLFPSEFTLPPPIKNQPPIVSREFLLLAENHFLPQLIPEMGFTLPNTLAPHAWW
jgi:DNA polymerase